MSIRSKITVDDFLSRLYASVPKSAGGNGVPTHVAANAPTFGAMTLSQAQGGAGHHALTANAANPLGSAASAATHGAPAQNAPNGAGHGSVGPGGRNKYLTSLAGSYRARGMSQNDIEKMLLISNRILCAPPVSDFEVRQIAASVSKYPPPRTNAGIAKSLNDIGNAERFVRHHGGEVRYIPEFGKWLLWDQGRWSIDDHQTRLMVLAKATVADIYKEIDVMPAPDQNLVARIAKHANESHNSARLKAMLAISVQDSALVVPVASLDIDPMLLGVANGVVELTTGQMRPYKREDLITRIAPVTFDPSAKCPKFLRFMKRITGIFDHLPKPKDRRAQQREFINYLQRVIGYCLTARTTEQVLFFFFGSGANGKTTLLNVLSALLGTDLAKQTQPETLMEVRHGKSSINNDIARLHGSRLVLANETGESQFLSEPLVKHLTGGDPISARFLYKEHFEFTPKFKLIISGNHKPVIRGVDHGIWRRIQLVPFGVTIPQAEQDKNLEKKLREELPGILNWAIKGCLAWQRGGLMPPKVVTDAIKEYREEMDVLGHWIEENCDVDPNATSTSSDLYLDFRMWADSNGLTRMPLVTFSRKLGDRGFERCRSCERLSGSAVFWL